MVLVDQTLSGAIFLSYLGLAYNILTPAKGISKAFYNIKKGDAAAQRVLEILEAKDDMEDELNIFFKNMEIFRHASHLVGSNASYYYVIGQLLNGKKGVSLSDNLLYSNMFNLLSSH